MPAQTQALRVPMQDAARAHLERSAKGAIAQVRNILRDAHIGATIRVQLARNGHGRLLVATHGMGKVETTLLLPDFVNGFRTVVI